MSNEKVQVFIPTRARSEIVRKSLPKWFGVGVSPENLFLVIDPKDSHMGLYRSLATEFGCGILRLDDSDMGLGYIRDFILDESCDFGESFHVQADDDYYPTGGDVNSFARVVLDKWVVGCGASYSYHGLTLGNETIKLNNVDFPNPSPGLGGNVFAINNDLADSLNGFPWWATCLGEDHEMIRQSIEAGYPWYYSTRLRISGLARYSDGGHMDLYGKPFRRTVEEKIVHKMIHERWPDYVSKPPAKYRSAWKKMMEAFIPPERLRLPVKVRRAYEARK